MNVVYAFAISASVIASITTLAFLSFPGLLIWCAFIGWAAYLQSGGAASVISSVSTSMLFGAFMAWLFAVILSMGLLPFGIPVAAALIVAVMAPVMVIAQKIGLLSVVPATFYGFACSFAFLAQTEGVFNLESLLSFSLANSLIIVPVSLFIGVFLGWLHATAAGKLTQQEQ